MNQELGQELQEQLDECRKQAEEYLNGWKRAKADLVNFQKQTEKEKEEWFSFAQAGFVRAILPVVDSMKQANEILPERSASEVEGPSTSSGHIVLDGIERIYSQLLDILKRMGVEEIKSIGEPLNPECHEVVSQEHADNKTPGLIIKEVQKGYLLNGRVLRPAKVIVSE